jgi:hypothetical protein
MPRRSPTPWRPRARTASGRGSSTARRRFPTSQGCGLGSNGWNAQLDELFRGVWDRPAGGLHLRQIQVGLAVTTEGSIGIASAGAQVSLMLVYQREQPDGDDVG